MKQRGQAFLSTIVTVLIIVLLVFLIIYFANRT